MRDIAKSVIAADGAGITAFRSSTPLQPTLLLNQVVRLQEVNMKPFVNVLVASAVVLCLWGQAPALSADEPAVRLEFRRAETKPAKDLEETTIPKTGEKLYLHKAAEVKNEDIAEASIDEENKPDPLLKLKFTKQGQQKMEKLTKDHLDKPLAVLVDGKVVAAPIIRSTLS